MTLAERSIRRPITVWMVLTAAILFGAIALGRLSLDLLPELTYPSLTIRTTFDGAAPAEVEEQVTRRIEQRVGVASGVRKMRSISAMGQSDVVLEFRWGTNMDLAAIEVREKLDLVRLPLEVEKPVLLRLNPNLDPIFRLTLTQIEDGPDPAEDLRLLRQFADDFVKRRLDAVPGVAAVIVAGGFEEEVHVQIDQERLAQLDLSVQDLANRLQATNVNLSGGSLKEGGQEYLVRTLNEFETIKDIGDAIIYEAGGRILRLADVAEVKEGAKDRDAVMRVNGREAVEIAIYKEGDGNTVAVAANVREALERLQPDLGDEMQTTVIYDQSTFIESAIDEVGQAALQGAVLAVLVLLLFLRSIRATLIVALTIPASVLVTFGLMRNFDVSLNVMSLGGIALAVGMLMDNAIVVLENIARRQEGGDSLRIAAAEGSSEVSGAVLASTLTTIAVFLPLAFVDGIAGQLFEDQALTVTFALIVSLLLAMTLIPMLSAAGSEAQHGEGVQGPRFILAPLFAPIVWCGHQLGAGFDRLLLLIGRGFARLLDLALRAPWTTLGVGLLSASLTALLLTRLPLVLIPEVAQGEFKVNLQLASGSPIELTDKILAETQLSLIDDPLIGQTYSVAGTGGRLDASAVSGGENLGEINVVLDESREASAETLAMERARELLSRVPDASFLIERPQLFTFSNPLEIEISGLDLADLGSVSDALVAMMEASGAFLDIESSWQPGYPELQIEFDDDRIAALGLTVPQVAQRVVDKVRGNVPTTFNLQDKQIDIRVRVAESERDSARDLADLVINPEAAVQVRLGAVANVITVDGPADIQRVGQQRVVVVSAEPRSGDLASAAAIAQRMLDEISHPPGVRSFVGGQNEEMEGSFQSLQLALILALILVYLVMASLFESLIHPLSIMLTIPFAMVGAVIALWATSTAISVVVFIGLILLVGIVVNNAIVLVDRVNELRRQHGLAKDAALKEGAAQRLRPILMTTLTTVLGLLPMALGFGDAAELRTPMAVTVIGGLLVSTLLTLVLIPVAYKLMDRSQ